MNICEMIKAFPDDKIGIQPLGPAITNVAQRKGATAITFVTDATTTSEVATNSGRIGIVVWFDREEFERLRQPGQQS